jgi:hypothetical protein
VAPDRANSHWNAFEELRRIRNRDPSPVVSGRLRAAIGLAVLLGHGLLIVAMRSEQAYVPARDALEVVFIDVLPSVVPQRIPPMPQPQPRPPDESAGSGAEAAVVPAPVPDSHDATVVAPSPSAPLRLFRDDGALELPAAALDDLRAVLSDDRQFEYRQPGLDDARRLFSRAPAIDAQTTRFAAGWIEQKDLGTAVLESAFKAASVEVKLGRSMTCVASLFGVFACSWGRVGYVAELDDPMTLDSDEAASCNMLWERIVDAREQREWRSLRAEFETLCRKPLARETPR